MLAKAECLDEPRVCQVCQFSCQLALGKALVSTSRLLGLQVGCHPARSPQHLYVCWGSELQTLCLGGSCFILWAITPAQEWLRPLSTGENTVIKHPKQESGGTNSTWLCSWQSSHKQPWGKPWNNSVYTSDPRGDGGCGEQQSKQCFEEEKEDG